MRKIYTAITIMLFAFGAIAQDLKTDFITFSVPNQVSSSIDTSKHTVKVFMPDGYDIAVLIPDFTLVKSATAFIGDSVQTSGISIVDFSLGAVIYTIKNDSVSQDWVVSAKIGTGIAFETELEVNVYPNPTTSYVTIDNAEFAKVSIYTVLGSLVKYVDATSPELTIYLGDLKRGMYLVRIQKGNQVITKKLSLIK